MPTDETPRRTHDERLNEAQREQSDHAAQALRNKPANAAAGMGGAGAAVMGPLAILGSFVVFMLYACIFPVGALIAIIVGVIVSMTFGALVPGVGMIGHFMVLLPFSFGALMTFQQREWRLESNRACILIRHALRLVFTFFIAGLTLDFLSGTYKTPGAGDLSKPDAWIHFAIVIAAVVTVHFVGVWYDRNYADTGAKDGRASSGASSGSAAEEFGPSGRPKFGLRFPGLTFLPSPLRRGLPVMTLAGGVFGAFLGYAAFETATPTIVGLFAGCIAGAVLMFTSWLVTRPVGALFDRIPLLWPLLMGSVVGAGIAWRLALADKTALALYLAPGMIGGAIAFTAPYMVYAIVRRFTARR